MELNEKFQRWDHRTGESLPLQNIALVKVVLWDEFWEQNKDDLLGGGEHLHVSFSL